MFVVASPVDADAPLASARDTPAIPNADKALLRRFLFEERLDMAQFSRPFGQQVTWRLFAKLGLPGVVPGGFQSLAAKARD